MGEENQNTTVSLRDKTRQFLDFQMNARKQQAQDFWLKRAKQQQDLYTSWLSSTNPEISKQCTKAVRVGQIAEWIRDYFSKPENWWEDYSNIEDVPLVDNYISLNPDRKAQLYDYVLEDNQICDPTQLYTDMGWIEEDNESPISTTDIWIWVWIWTTVWLTDAALYWAGKLWQRGWKQIYNIPIDKTMKESNKLISAWANIKDAEVAVNDAKLALKKAKSIWEWVEDAQKALATAQDTLKNAKAKWKSIRTIWDTAMEYDIWGWLTEWWTAQSRWIQARHEANQIFKRTIAPALENSKATINVQELINWLADDIKEIAKNDPDKLNAYNEALESLKDSYKWEEFAKYSLKDSQTLKSWLQWRTPQKFWKWQEITNELQELKWLLSNKLKNAVHSELTKEIWEDSAKLYLDRANLDAYSKSMAKQATNAWLKQGFWNFWSSTFHNLTDWAFAKWWLLLDKVGKWLETVTNPKKIAQWAWDVWNYIVKNGKNFLKATKWWMARVEDPVGLVQLLRLVPWSIWEAADAAAENPAVAMDDLLFEIQDFKDTWNSMSDEERIQNIKDQFEQTYGSELNDESAIETYKKWKEKHPSGKYWFRDTVNDVELIMKA